MPSRHLEDLCEKLQPLAVQFLSDCDKDPILAGCHVFLTCTYRSAREQDEAYKVGRSTPGKIITNAKGGESPHNCVFGNKPASKAFDFAILDPHKKLDWNGEDELWKRAIAIGEALGLESGEHFPRKDYAHMQIPGWKDGPTA